MFTPQLGGHSQHRHRGVVGSVPDLGEGPGGPGPRPPTNRGPPAKSLYFLANDVSLVILIALLTFALDDLEFNSTPSSVEIRLRMHQN